MKYKGIELVEITEPQIFSPPKKMLVWGEHDKEARVDTIYAIGPSSMDLPVRAISGDGRFGTHCYEHCAENPKTRRATWKELAYWLMDGKGLIISNNTNRVDTGVIFDSADIDKDVSDNLKVMRRDDNDWHEPTADYMGLEE